MLEGGTAIAGGGAPPAPPPAKPPPTPPPTPAPTPAPTPPSTGSNVPAGLPPLPDPATWTGGLISMTQAKELVEEGYPAQMVSDWQRQIENHLLASGQLTGTPVPVAPIDTTPAPPAPAEPGDGLADPSEGDPAGDPGPEPTAADYQTWDDQRTLEAAGVYLDSATPHPVPGTIIGEPYQGTHGKAFNIAGGSDNWQSENAVDVWLPPGTPIIAIEGGIVSPGGWGFGLSAAGGRFAGYRLHLVTDPFSPKVCFYTHMRSLVVKRGQRVQLGELLGYSGIANGVPHLHFAVQPGFNPGDYVRSAYSLTGTALPASGTSPGAGASPGPTAAPVKTAGVEDAWTTLMRAVAYTLPDATVHIRAARAAVGPAVS